jgi:dipeptidyl aminopeptidase/acylaminoacyl peptidase
VPDPRGRRSLPTKLISSSQWDDDPQFSPDGKRIAFGSNRSGHYESWVCDSDGRNPKQLTSIPEASITGSARWSPDGRAIAFGSFTNDLSRVFVVSSDGGSPRTLIEENGGGFVPSWSRDGSSIYFCSDRKGSLQIWKVPSEGGKEVQVTMNGGLESFEAADGKTLYYSKLDRGDPNSGSARLWKVPVDGGKETLVFSKTIYPRYWTVTDQGIYFVPSDWAGSPAIEFFSFATGKVTQVVPLEKPPVRGFHPGLAVSPDGRWILCALLEQDTSDIMLVENFR